jgi:hypothetical protein
LDNVEDTYTPLEDAVMAKMLAGDNPVLSMLRGQYAKSRVSIREWTGVGFFTTIETHVGSSARPDIGRLHIADVSADIDGLQHGAGFVLHVTDGLIDYLEGFTYDEPWPEVVDDFSVSYVTGDDRAFTLAAIDEALRHSGR